MIRITYTIITNAVLSSTRLNSILSYYFINIVVITLCSYDISMNWTISQSSFFRTFTPSRLLYGYVWLCMAFATLPEACVRGVTARPRPSHRHRVLLGFTDTERCGSLYVPN